MPRVKKYKATPSKNRKGQYPTASQLAKMRKDRKRHQKGILDGVLKGFK